MRFFDQLRRPPCNSKKLTLCSEDIEITIKMTGEADENPKFDHLREQVTAHCKSAGSSTQKGETADWKPGTSGGGRRSRYCMLKRSLLPPTGSTS